MSEPPSSSGRYILALLLAHLAASFSFAAAMILSSDIARLLAPFPSAFFPQILKQVGIDIITFLPITIWASLLTALFLAPYSLAGALVVWPVIALSFGRLTTVLIAGLFGGVFCALRIALAVKSEDIPSTWTSLNLQGEISSIIAGAAYGWVIWRLLIKPGKQANIRSEISVTQ